MCSSQAFGFLASVSMSHFQKLSKGNFYYFISGFECVTIQHFPQIGVRFHVYSERVGAEEQMQMKKYMFKNVPNIKVLMNWLLYPATKKSGILLRWMCPFPRLCTAELYSKGEIKFKTFLKIRTRLWNIYATINSSCMQFFVITRQRQLVWLSVLFLLLFKKGDEGYAIIHDFTANNN